MESLAIIVGEKLGTFLGSSLVSWKGRIGLVIFAFFWCTSGFWAALIITIIYNGVFWFWEHQGEGNAEQLTTHGSARWAGNSDLFDSIADGQVSARYL